MIWVFFLSSYIFDTLYDKATSILREMYHVGVSSCIIAGQSVTLFLLLSEKVHTGTQSCINTNIFNIFQKQHVFHQGLTKYFTFQMSCSCRERYNSCLSI